MSRADDKTHVTTPAMWPAQHLAERVAGAVYHTASDAAAAVARWCRHQALEQELQALADHELADLGITRGQIALLARADEAPELMRRMMERLGITQALLAKHPGLKQHLERECSLCCARGECRRWLDRAASDAGHAEFCPNAPAFEELKAKS